MAVINKDLYVSVMDYDYNLGVSLPNPNLLTGDVDVSYQKIINHNYTTKEKLPSLKKSNTDNEDANIEYDDIINYNYAVDKVESRLLETVRFLEDVIEKIHPQNLKLHTQNKQLKQVVVKIQAEKQELMRLADTDNVRLINDLKDENEKMRSRMTAQILNLADELDKERQKTLFQTGLFDRIIGRDRTIEQVKSSNARLMAKNRILNDEIKELKQRLTRF